MPNLKFENQTDSKKRDLTFIFVVGCNCEDSMLNILVFVDLSLIKILVKIRWVVIFVRNSNSNIFCDGIGLASRVGSS